MLFIIVDKKLESFIKKNLARSYHPADNKVDYNKIYYCIYVRKLTHFQHCIFGKGEWIRDYNRNKEVRVLSEINIKAFADINTRIPIINESDGWYNWYYGLTVGKLYKVAVSRECMESCLSNCLSEVIVKKDEMYYFDNTSDMMFLGQKKG